MLQNEWIGIQGMPAETILSQIEHLEDRLRALRAALAERRSQQGPQQELPGQSGLATTRRP